MSVIFLVLPLALILAGAFLALFFWALRGGQFDDLETPAVRLALEERAASVSAPAGSAERGRRSEVGVVAATRPAGDGPPGQ